MTLEELDKYLAKEPISDKLVHLRYKYSWEKKWRYSNEILVVDDRAPGYYAWLHDWNEGQEDVEILGRISIDDIELGTKEGPCGANMQEIMEVIHKTIYQFFEPCGDHAEELMSDKEELLLAVNKAICNNLKALERKET